MISGVGTMITAIEFCSRWSELLDSLQPLLNDDAQWAIEDCYRLDPHDLVMPEQCFLNHNECVGLAVAVLLRMMAGEFEIPNNERART